MSPPPLEAGVDRLSEARYPELRLVNVSDGSSQGTTIVKSWSRAPGR
jgi:hypothetical protein